MINIGNKTPLSTTVNVKKKISVDVGIKGHEHVDIEFGNVNIIEREAEKYSGSYSLCSATDEIQVIPTKDKVMEKDITVMKIPVWEVSNDSDGMTCIIGKENVYGL